MKSAGSELGTFSDSDPGRPLINEKILIFSFIIDVIIQPCIINLS